MQFVQAFTVNLGPISYLVQTIGSVILEIAPALIILSYMTSAAMWVFAGPSDKLVKMARQQFVATTVSLVIIGGYYIFKTVAMNFANGGFGAN